MEGNLLSLLFKSFVDATKSVSFLNNFVLVISCNYPTDVTCSSLLIGINESKIFIK